MKLTQVPDKVSLVDDFTMGRLYSDIQFIEKQLDKLKLAIKEEVTDRMKKDGKDKWHFPGLRKSFRWMKTRGSKIDVVSLVDRLPDATAYLSITKDSFKTLKELYPEEDFEGLEIEIDGRMEFKMIDDMELTQTAEAMERRIVASGNQTTKYITGGINEENQS